MEMVRLSLRWIGALALLTGFSSAYAANPTVEDLLKLKPKQDGVVISTPSSEAEIAACKVEEGATVEAAPLVRFTRELIESTGT